MKFIGGHKATHHVVRQAAEIMMRQNDHKKHVLIPLKDTCSTVSHTNQCLYIINGSHFMSHERGYLY